MNNKAIDEALSDAEDKDKLEEGDSVTVVNGSTHVTSTAWCGRRTITIIINDDYVELLLLFIIKY